MTTDTTTPAVRLRPVFWTGGRIESGNEQMHEAMTALRDMGYHGIVADAESELAAGVDPQDVLEQLAWALIGAQEGFDVIWRSK